MSQSFSVLTSEVELAPILAGVNMNSVLGAIATTTSLSLEVECSSSELSSLVLIWDS
jgi:hypothetical protein